MSRRARAWLPALAGALAVTAAAMARDAVLTAHDPELRACADRLTPERSMVQKQDVKVVSEAGWVRESSRTVYWKRFEDGVVKMLFTVDAPRSEAGLKVLVVRGEAREPVVHVYTPETGRARRIAGGGAANSVLGTDFTYEDAIHLERFAEAAGSRRAADGRIDGRPVFVVETTPMPEASAYSLIRIHIDKASCIPLRTDFFAPNGATAKTLTMERPTHDDPSRPAIPRRMAMIDHQRGSRTEFTVSALELDVELDDRLFTLAEIKKSRR